MADRQNIEGPTRPRPALYDYFQRMAKTLQAKYDQSKALKASINEGKAREIFIHDFLSNVLPPWLSVGQGEIWNSAGGKTGEIDVIVSRQDAPRLTFETGPHLSAFLAEGVFAAVEVKTELSTAKLRDALDRLRVVRKTCPPAPISFGVGPALDRPLCAIFAYEGVTYGTLMTELQDPKNVDVVDFVCILSEGGWVRTETGKLVGMNPAGPGTPLPFVGLWKPGPALAMFYYFLNQFGASFSARAISIAPYFSPIEGWGD